MKISARILLQLPIRTRGMVPVVRIIQADVQTRPHSVLSLLCTLYKAAWSHTQVLMFLNKLNVLPFGSNIYPKRKGRMARNNSREWRQSSLCFVSHSALTVWRISRSKCLQIIVTCVKLLTAVEGKVVFWDMTPCSRAGLYSASRRNLRPSSAVICLEYRGRTFLRNIGTRLRGAWFDCLEECSL
jgi:hypothetical protein